MIASYTIVTAPAYNMLSKKGYVATFTMAINVTKILVHGTVFVDNEDRVITADFGNLMEEIADQPQKGSVSKVAEMRPLGQTFRLDKMGCCLISFKPYYILDKP